MGRGNPSFLFDYYAFYYYFQAWFFVALCRSIGIVARTVGAMHDINGPDGYHAWAEVNIPGYGWIPVDTSIAELVDNSYNAKSEEREAFHEYYFKNQDPFRYYVQINSDIPVTPKPRYDIDTIFFSRFRWLNVIRVHQILNG